jgi:hypothetical protein
MVTKTERQIRDFSSGMRKLSDNNLNYIQKLTHVLFMVEHLPVYSGPWRKAPESKKTNRIFKVTSGRGK